MSGRSHGSRGRRVHVAGLNDDLRCGLTRLDASVRLERRAATELLLVKMSRAATDSSSTEKRTAIGDAAPNAR